MKLALLAVGSFVVSLVGSTVVVVMLTDAEPDPVTVQAQQLDAAADSVTVQAKQPDATADPDTVTLQAQQPDAAADLDPVTLQAEQPDAAAGPAAQPDVLESAEDTTQSRGNTAVILAASDRDTTEAEAVASVPSPAAEAVEVTALANPAPWAAVVPSSVQEATQENDVDDNEESIRRLARIFSAMRSAEAADVLKYLDDAEIVSILSFLNSRKAAGVLSALSEERAAAVSRVLMGRRGGKERLQ